MLSPRRSHPIPALFATAALAFGGCGGDDEAASPLDEALGFLPQDAGVALVASTDTGDYDDFRQMVEKFPFGDRFEDVLLQSFEARGLDLEQDAEPLAGNELVVGVADNQRFLSDEKPSLIFAWQTEDSGKLRDLVEDNGDERGEAEGYTLYETREGWGAVKDDVLVAADDEDTLRRALEQRGEDDRLTEDDVEAAFEALPDDAPVRAYVNVRELLAASPKAERALQVEWVDHIETLGLSADAAEDAIVIDWSLRTDSEGLSDEDLPLASGSEAPQLLERRSGNAEVVFGLRDPSQAIDFALATAEVVDPAGFAEFERGKQAVGRQLGVDVDEDVLAQLTGDVAALITIDREFGVRAALEDADAFEGTLARVMKRLPEFAEGTTVTEPKQGDRFYGVATADGDSFAVGVAEDALVIANNAELASEVATRSLVDADGQEGAFVSAADAEQLANAAIARYADSGLEALGGTLFTGPLGELLQSVSASTEGLSGRLELTID